MWVHLRYFSIEIHRHDRINLGSVGIASLSLPHLSKNFLTIRLTLFNYCFVQVDRLAPQLHWRHFLRRF